jgi:galactose mutarotase-like enzyme
MAAIRHKGAELVSLQSVATQKEYIWVGNPNFWGKHSPILFPIVGTLKHNSFTYKDKTYALSRHGFARDRVFELVSQSEHELVFSLLSDEESWAVYPFAFELQVVYTIKESELRISYKVFNKGSEVMYYAIGGHPALALPNTFEDYNLLFEPNETLVCYTLENDLLSDKTKNIALHDTKLPLTYSLFEHDALIFMSFLSKQIQLLENNTPILNFKFKDFPNFGIWTKVGAPFICLEPWAGYSDVLDASGRIEDKEGIQLLAVDSSKAYQFSIEIL